MGELKIYQTLEEKSSNFGVARIDTKIQFDDFFDERKSGNSIWRGMPDASHKLYTSLQRFWITNDLDKIEDNIFDYLESVIDGTLQWQNQTITNYYKHLTNQDPSFLAVLSLLRHHDSPSPLIDWTRNPKVALLFALMEHPNRHTSTIPNYFSVYEISPEYNWTKANIKQSTHDLLCGLLDPNVAAKDPEGYETLKDVLDGCLIST
ncbi:MAG TPA: FRG domain-containing protein, partial [Bacteroidia bacterium]|nr:FRG domain-containing protein [Bacteroidia bacterium]